MILKSVVTALCGVFLCAAAASGAFLIEVDVDGQNDGAVTFNPKFSFGGDTTTASQSMSSLAVGLTGGDSIFGGDGVARPDTYIVTYSPGIDPDNLVLTPGTDLGDGNVATGAAGGGLGKYDVYATWPLTDDVGGTPISYTVNTPGDQFSVQLDQNSLGDEWIKLGTINYSSGAIVVTQETSSNTFVSMRLAGVLVEAVPEPAGVSLLVIGLCLMVRGVRRP